MPETIEGLAYSFDELDDKAKEKARDWYREHMHEIEDLSERNYDDFERVAEIIGISFKPREKWRSKDGTKVHYGPTIYWSGFCSQGDGACFEGDYAYKPDAVTKIREYCSDETLFAIVDNLASIQEAWLYGITATVTHTGRYYHEHSTDIEVFDGRDTGDGSGGGFDEEEAVREELRNFMRWMYSQLEADNDYLESDEAVDESITANDYKFDEEGDRHAYA